MATLDRQDKYAFSDWNASLASWFHSKCMHLLRTRKKGWQLSTNLDMKRPKATVQPIRRWTSFTFRWCFILSTACTLSGFASMPWLLIINPKNFQTFRVKLHIILAKDLEHSLQIHGVPLIMHAFDNHVIYINFHICPDEGLTDFVHQPLVGFPGIF